MASATSLHFLLSLFFFIIILLSPSLAFNSGIRQVTDSSTSNLTLHIRNIPGSYGLPILGPIQDRKDYFYNQGRHEFFRSRIEQYNSTVYRVNMPPGPPIAGNPHVIVLLDGKSFPVLFDVSKVEKRDIFVGTFMPSTSLTGGYRVLAYLDPSEPKHNKIKSILFNLLKSRRDHVIPEFRSTYGELFVTIENELESKGRVGFGDLNDQAAFNFLTRAYFGVSPVYTDLKSDGPKIAAKWILFHLSPLLTLGLPSLVEEASLRTAPFPPLLIKSDYDRLYNFISSHAGQVLDDAEKMGISREEMGHNIVFATFFNSFGGFKVMFPVALTWLNKAGVGLHAKLANEIRYVIQSNDGNVTMGAIERMPLVKSVVYELLRVDPPVPAQYGKAKRDLIIESHDAAFEVKKGEMLFGFQPFATRDPKIFDRAEEFVPDRFVGEEGERLLKHVMWSNGPETEDPTLGNKQCAGKNFVVMVFRLYIVELFLRYDTFEIEVGKSPLGADVKITSLTKASYYHVNEENSSKGQ